MRNLIKYFILIIICFTTAIHMSGCKKAIGKNTESKPHGHDHKENTPSVTLWTEKAEYFIKHSNLIKDEASEFTIYLTDLSESKPILAGRLTFETKTPSGNLLKTAVPVPAKPGVFYLRTKFPEAGSYDIKIKIKGINLRDETFLNDVVVYDNHDAIKHQHIHTNKDNEISFLKEQQWLIGLKSEPAEKNTLYDSFLTSAKVIPEPENIAQITSPVAGKLILDKGIYNIPVIGEAVEKGQVLAVVNPLLSPSSLEFNLGETKNRWSKAINDYERAKQLYDSGAISLKKLQEAELNYKIEESRYNNLLTHTDPDKEIEGRHIENHSNSDPHYIHLRSPISGRIVSSNFLLGSHVNIQDNLFTVIDLSKVFIEAQVYEHDIPKVSHSHGANFIIPGYEDKIFSINKETGRLVNIGVVVDDKTRTVPVIYEVQNPGLELRIGMYVEFSILTSKSVNTISIPKTAVQEDNGRFFAFVQTGGESFVRRDIITGLKDKGLIEVKSGINSGERVVTSGAYQIKLSSSDGNGLQNSHGHVH